MERMNYHVFFIGGILAKTNNLIVFYTSSSPIFGCMYCFFYSFKCGSRYIQCKRLCLKRRTPHNKSNNTYVVGVVVDVLVVAVVAVVVISYT